MTTIPILLGSIRTDGNCRGIASWVISRWTKLVDLQSVKTNVALASTLLPDLPLGGIIDPKMGAQVTNVEDYADPAVREWSKLVSSSPALIIISPQYNWGYPGILKNALDHLYYEWKGKPILLITYGGHGGNKCAVQLQQVLEGGFKTVFVSEPVMVTLPKTYISGTDRVHEGSDTFPPFLSEYEANLDAVLSKLWDVTHNA